MFIILCSAFIEYSCTIPKFRGAIKANDKNPEILSSYSSICALSSSCKDFF